MLFNSSVSLCKDYPFYHRYEFCLANKMSLVARMVLYKGGKRTTKQRIRWGFVSSQREYSKRHENGEKDFRSCPKLKTNQAKLTDPNEHPYFCLCLLTFACHT